MEVKYRKISELRAAEYNPRLCSLTEEADIRASLKQFGMVNPIVINVNPDRKDVVIGGHKRLKIWSETHDTIPTVEISLPLDRERELNIRLNKNTGHWDFDILKTQFDKLELALWGFRDEDFKMPDMKTITKEVTFNIGGTSKKHSLRVDFGNQEDCEHWQKVLSSKGFKIKKLYHIGGGDN